MDKITLEDIKKATNILNSCKVDAAKQRILSQYEFEYISRCLLEYESLKKENDKLKARF